MWKNMADRIEALAPSRYAISSTAGKLVAETSFSTSLAMKIS